MRINVKPEELRNSGKKVKTLAEDFLEEVENLYSISNGVIEHWTGSATDEFVTSVESYHSDMTKLGRAAYNYGDFQVKSANIYEQTQTGIARDASNL